MSKLRGLGQAKARKGGVYFLAGQYLVEITKVHMMQSRKREDLFIIECLVLESNVPERPVGSRPAQVINLKQDAALGNIKSFIAACSGMDDPDDCGMDEDEWESMGEFVVSAENPLCGIRLHLTCVERETRTGGSFTLHNWGPLAEAQAA